MTITITHESLMAISRAALELGCVLICTNGIWSIKGGDERAVLLRAANARLAGAWAAVREEGRAA